MSSVIAGILPDVAGQLDVSISAAGLLVTAYAIGMIIGGPVLTALTSGVVRKPLITVLLVIVMVGKSPRRSRRPTLCSSRHGWSPRWQRPRSSATPS